MLTWLWLFCCQWLKKCPSSRVLGSRTVTEFRYSGTRLYRKSSFERPLPPLAKYQISSYHIKGISSSVYKLQIGNVCLWNTFCLPKASTWRLDIWHWGCEVARIQQELNEFTFDINNKHSSIRMNVWLVPNDVCQQLACCMYFLISAKLQHEARCRFITRDCSLTIISF